jgi:arylsulfatase A-like enzyme
MMAVYAAMISSIDRSLGDLVAGLKARNQLDNTLILFMSDNGGNAETGVPGIAKTAPGGRLGDKNSNVFIGQTWATLNNTPFTLFKHFTHEGGIATPLIVHWPNGISKVAQGSMVTNPGHVIDVMPTVLEITGAHYPQEYRNTDILPFSGVSLVPNFKGQAITRDEPIFWEHEGNRAVRDGKWKLVSRLGYQWQLFDMDQDRTELNDLADKYPDRVKTMSNQYDAWAANDYVDLWPEAQARTDAGAKVKKKTLR